MYAVYKELDNERSLCKLWNGDVEAYTYAVFPVKSGAELFAKTMSLLRGNEIYKYTVVPVAVTSCGY